jgi:hypothetical protein
MSDKQESPDAITQALWSAIFRGTRLRRIRQDDPRIFILRSINWGRQQSKVQDVETGQVFIFPWTELEFVDPVESNLPEWAKAPATF